LAIHPVTIYNKKQFLSIINQSRIPTLRVLASSGPLDVGGLAEGDTTIAGCDSLPNAVYIAGFGIHVYLG
jgi:hypothetical protein